MQDYEKQRRAVKSAKRIVVKVGSRVLVTKTGRPNHRRISDLVRQMAGLRREGREVILCSSGAIAAGIEALKLNARPSHLPELQMAAAVGQVRLMTAYDRLFVKENCRIGQVLLTHDDLKNRTRHLNARNTMLSLLEQGIIPIVNENDVVSVDEIKVGDNDLLAALVTILIEADCLLLLTTADGFRAPTGVGKSRRVPYLTAVTDEELAFARGKGSDFSLGGMASKLQSAQTAANVGVRVVIADGRQKDIIPKIMQGEDIGTLIGTSGENGLSKIKRRKRWIAFFHKTKGSLVVDDGAQMALQKQGNSLLPIGIREVIGHFPKGALVFVKSLQGEVVAKGLVDFSSDQIEMIKGRRTSEIESILGFNDYDEVIHRENMVVLLDREGREK
jgi:glutamate 5-kinase